MKTDNEPHRLDLSRRRLLRSATLAAAAGAFAAVAATGSAALAASKFSQAMAKYQPTPKGANRCANCSLYESAGNCKVVEGKVAPDGWCMLYVRKAG
jgi:nitrous oxide reductase